MPALSTINPTLLDVAKRLDPNGNIDKIVEILNQSNEVLDDMVWIEGNSQTGNRTTVRTGIPAPTWRRLYGGVQPTKSTTAQVTDNCGMLEAYAEVDKALADLNGNTAEFRMSEEKPIIEGFNQEVTQTLFYGNESTAPAEFTGLAPRFNSLSAPNNSNVLSAGGTGSDNTSIWLVVWDSSTVHGIYPKGSKAGLSMKDLGEVTVENVDGANGRMQAYRTHYRWDCGLTVRDWRYVVRIPNVDVSDLQGLVGTQALTASTSILRRMISALEVVPSLSVGRAAFYVNRGVRAMLRQAILDKIANNLTFEVVAGKRVVSYDGIPVRRVDQLLENESVVS